MKYIKFFEDTKKPIINLKDPNKEAIINKLEEVFALAKELGDKNTMIVVRTLIGSKRSNDDGFVAGVMIEVAKKLLSDIDNKKNIGKN